MSNMIGGEYRQSGSKSKPTAPKPNIKGPKKTTSKESTSTAQFWRKKK